MRVLPALLFVALPPMLQLKQHRILVSNRSGVRLPAQPIKSALSKLLDTHSVPYSEISVLLTDDEHIRSLNRQYRNIDEPTDVLTFPGSGAPNTPLGDIAISIDTAKMQAEHRKDTLANELCFLAIHGGLHLLGYDDQTEDQRSEMIRLMNDVAVKLGMKPDEHWCSLPHGVND